MSKSSQKRRFVQKNIEQAPKGPGVYRLYDGPKLSYVGSSSDMSGRLERHLASPRFDNITSFDVRKTQTTQEARKSEARAIQQKKPPQNHT
jgi:excinuclease UvrABC nuclease subunit